MADALVLAAALSGAAGAVAGFACGRIVRRTRRRAQSALRREGARLVELAEQERRRALLAVEVRVRRELLDARTRHDQELRREEEALAQTAAAEGAREAELEARQARASERKATVQAAAARLSQRPEAAQAQAARDGYERAWTEALEQAAGQRRPEVVGAVAEAEVEAARAEAAQIVRHAEQGAADPEQVRRAKRLLGISVGRFEGHYLTERHLSTVFLGEPRNGEPLVHPDALAVVGEIAHVTLTLTERQDAVRLEGLDGVGREVARRTLARLLRRPAAPLDDVRAVARELSGQVEREVVELGRKAFATLQIPRAHPDIVKLVGRLNWRTSYTQNQWKHAIEAAFLCGMLAEELGLDLRLARRAALMHDIGKALTHELDGSHAVIGADYARRLGETEVVANAIGAHHTDEPFASPYAYLVAAADAMSGARPGARRQTEENYGAKLADLERITRGFSGVAEAFAVQGGREVRVYVHEGRVDDRGAVQLCSEIADAISREMTFPGQIKVTVIRELCAVSTAG